MKIYKYYEYKMFFNYEQIEDKCKIFKSLCV